MRIIYAVILLLSLAGCPSSDNNNNFNSISNYTTINSDPVNDSPANPVPEPVSLVLVGAGMVGLALFARKKKK